MNAHAPLVLGIIASVILSVLAFFFSIFMVATVPEPEIETVLVASVTWVPPSEIPRLEEEYWDRNIVPLCVDLPTIQDFGVEAEPVACFLEVVK